MKIKNPRTEAIQDVELRRFYEDIFKLTNRNISFGTEVNGQDQNIAGYMAEIANTGAANTQVIITHNLGRIPLYIDFKYKNIAGDWYQGATAWTKTQVFINFTIPNMHVRLFIH